MHTQEELKLRLMVLTAARLAVLICDGETKIHWSDEIYFRLVQVSLWLSLDDWGCFLHIISCQPERS